MHHMAYRWVSLSVCLSVCLSMCLSVCLFVCLSVNQSDRQLVRTLECQSVSQSICHISYSFIHSFIHSVSQSVSQSISQTDRQTDSQSFCQSDRQTGVVLSVDPHIRVGSESCITGQYVIISTSDFFGKIWQRRDLIWNQQRCCQLVICIEPCSNDYGLPDQAMQKHVN